MMANKSPKKMLSLLIVVLFVLSPMAVLLQNGEANQSSGGERIKSIDLNITSTFVIDENTIDPITGQRGMYGQDGNITVANGGTLIIRNASLYFLQDNGNNPTDPSDDHHYWLRVESGGRLIMENSTLTVVDWAINPYLKLPVTIEGKATITDSTLAFPGNFTVSNGVLYANNTIFTALDNVEQYDYNQDGNADAFDVDDNDDSPIMSFVNSKVVFADSRVEHYYENTHVPQYIYFYPSHDAGTAATGQDITALYDDDDIDYMVDPSEEMRIDQFSNGPLYPYGLTDSSQLYSATITVRWDSNASYNGTGYIYINGQRTDIQPTSGGSSGQTDLMDYGIQTLGDIRTMIVNFTHNGNSGSMPFDQIEVQAEPIYNFNMTVDSGEFYAINTYFDLDFRDDDMRLHDTLVSKNGAVLRFYNVTVDESETTGHPNFVFLPEDTSEIYFYGWANIWSTDGNSTDPTPVPYCRVTSRYYAPSPDAINITSENNTLHNGDPVLEYLNRTSPDRTIDETNYNITNASGNATIPLLKNLITASDLNGLFLGNYLVTVDEHIHNTSLSKQINFPPYPEIKAENNTFNAHYAFSWEYPPRDLEISDTDVSIQPSPIIRGDLVWVNVTIHNTGGINVTSTFGVQLLIDGNEVNRSKVIQPVERNGGTVTVNLTWQTEFGDYGQHNLTVVVDFLNDIPESNESNNNVTIPINVEALYDLSISSTDISWAPANPYTYNDIIITAVIHNTGHANITQDFEVEFFVNGASIGTDTVTQNISYGGTATANIHFTTDTQDIYNVSVTVDSTDVIKEDDENNNEAYRLMTVNPTPDLIISDIGFLYSNPYSANGYHGVVEGMNVTVSATVKNIGETYANGTITVDFYDGDPGAGGIHIGSASIVTLLFSGQEVSLDINWTATSPYGTHSIYGVVSFTENAGEPPETNTDNNQNYENITVYMRPNLRFTGEYHYYDSTGNETSSVIENNTVKIEVVIENVGGYPASFSVSFFDSDQSRSGWIGNVSVPYLDAGDETIVSVSYSPTPMGVHHITVTIDPQNSVNETNETDNTMSVTLNVIGFMDLSILPSDITYTPTAPLTYQQINITATVHNNGHRDITQSFIVDVMVDGQIINTSTIDSLPVGATYDVHASFIRSMEGNYQVSVKIDVEDTIAETNETNNVATITVYVGPRPEFSVGQPVVLTQYVVDNHDVTLAADVQNNGVAATGTVTVSFYDGNPDAGGTLIATTTYTDPGESWKATATVTWHATGVGIHTLYVRVTASTSPPEGYLGDNTAASPVNVLPRPDLTITNMTFLRNGEIINTTAGISECRGFDINVTIENLDGLLMYSDIHSFVVSFFNGPFTGNWSNLLGNVTLNNQTLLDTLDNGLPVNLSFHLSRFKLTPGTANIYAFVDSDYSVDESNENNNMFNRTIEIREMVLDIQVNELPSDRTIDLNQQSSLFLNGIVEDNGEPVSGIRITIELINTDTGVVGASANTTTGNDGRYTLDISLPQNPGDYELRVTAQKPDGSAASTTFQPVSLSIVKPAPSTAFPFWMMLLIAAILVIAALALTLFAVRRYALAKYVECGNCGRMIPAGSDKCPYCGAVFDKETVKCSVCGAWIPADAKECPNCGAKFLVTGKEIVDYETQMRKQYEEFVDRFRRQAKKELGKEFTEEKFQQWWKSQKSYVTFEEWLKREEERKKTGGIICPVCGALNSKTDIVCHVCGSPLRPTKKKVKTEGIEEAAISKIELPSLEEEKEEEGEALEKKEGEEETGEEAGEEKEAAEEEIKMPLAEEKTETAAPRPVKKVVKKVVKRPVAPPAERAEETGPEEEAKAPELPKEFIAEIRKEGTPPAPPETEKKPEEGAAPVVKKKVVKKVVKKKVVKK